jgi:hypothetical protein
MVRNIVIMACIAGGIYLLSFLFFEKRLENKEWTMVSKEQIELKLLFSRILEQVIAQKDAKTIAQLIDPIKKERGNIDILISPVTKKVYHINPDIKNWYNYEKAGSQVAIYCDSVFDPSPRGAKYFGIGFNASLLYLNEKPHF